mmetsp:Transcript_6448/g.19057  ORF Transcript_6448/g.19057 Transcript_6448/m.19057 type:complete len:234 (-) Transcript_6448:248-949(-)
MPNSVADMASPGSPSLRCTTSQHRSFQSRRQGLPLLSPGRCNASISVQSVWSALIFARISSSPSSSMALYPASSSSAVSAKGSMPCKKAVRQAALPSAQVFMAPRRSPRRRARSTCLSSRSSSSRSAKSNSPGLCSGPSGCRSAPACSGAGSGLCNCSARRVRSKLPSPMPSSVSSCALPAGPACAQRNHRSTPVNTRKLRLSRYNCLRAWASVSQGRGVQLARQRSASASAW